jgi:hypothetical protein
MVKMYKKKSLIVRVVLGCFFLAFMTQWLHDEFKKKQFKQYCQTLRLKLERGELIPVVAHKSN